MVFSSNDLDPAFRFTSSGGFWMLMYGKVMYLHHCIMIAFRTASKISHHLDVSYTHHFVGLYQCSESV